MTVGSGVTVVNAAAVVRVAIVQMAARADVADNLDVARCALVRSGRAGAQLSVFPEVFLNDLTVAPSGVSPAERAQRRDGTAVVRMRALAREFAQWLVIGFVEVADGERVYNTTLLVNPLGQVAAAYRKTHLYDAFGVRESDIYMPGEELFAPISTPVGVLGLLVCYELRFPEVARVQWLRGAQLLIVPSAWYAGPGKERQWKTLVAARAVENNCYVLACNQAARSAIGKTPSRGSQRLVESLYCGQSMVVDPAGEVIAQLGEDEDVLLCDIDLTRIEAMRRTVPTRGQRRPSLYPDLL